MCRRRWRFVTIAAFLLFIIRDTQCQDENDYFYSQPVESSFAQVQPPLYRNSRPPTFFDHGDNFRVVPPSQQPLFNEGNVRFPSPNYNQNPTPFQLPTGRSQSGTQYYVNQPDFGPSQRQRFRPALPYNFQMIHPASTKRPDVPQIHSVAYQNDPSKPETFLGQITLNNPDIDYLQNNRFKNIPFDGNSLKSNGQSGHIVRDEDIDNDNHDLFDQPRVTTYNPSKHIVKQRLNIRPSSSHFPQYDTSTLDDKINTPNKISGGDNLKIPKYNQSSENKALLEIEPLLEDEISDLSYRELMKNSQGSLDVEVIKSNNSSGNESADDNEPGASSMNADNMPKNATANTLNKLAEPTTTTSKTVSDEDHTEHDDNHSGEFEDEGEYADYYDDHENVEDHTTTGTDSDERSTDIYDEYDTTDEPESATENVKHDEKDTMNVTEAFDVLEMKPNSTMVKDDNFKQFVDTMAIDHTDQLSKNETAALGSTNASISSDEEPTIDTPSLDLASIVGQEVVSVVTTKSVVNGTISIPDVTFAPSTTKLGILHDSSTENTNENDTSAQVTTENWIVVASVQTSRSVSGARFLPFPTVEQEEKKQVITDEEEEEEEEEEDHETVTKDPMLQANVFNNSSSSTENINDKLDSIQSELSSAVLSGSLSNENKNIELITESTTEQTTVPPTTTPMSLNVFTLKSTLSPQETERSSPGPLPVLIKKFTHRITTSTTPKPRKKPTLVTVMDDIPQGLLPPGFKSRLSYKDKRTSTTTTSTTTPIPASSEESAINGTQGRSSGINSKNRVILLDDKSLLPKEYKPKEKSQEDVVKKSQKDDINKFLPPGYKPPSGEAKLIAKTDIIDKVPKVDITAFLPKGFNLNATTTEKPKGLLDLPIKIAPVDITAFLPPGFKLNSSEKADTILDRIKIADVSSLLPPGFKLNSTEEEEKVQGSSTTKAPGGIKLVFPSRPGAKNSRKTTTSKTVDFGPSQVTPKIQKGWPTRATTEFTGWPSSSTTPFSIEKFLLQNMNVTTSLPEAVSTEATTRRSTTTTTTTTTPPPPPTTPGICRQDCDIAATIKIVSGVKWVPELLDHHTEEWKKLARDVKDELNSVYSKSDRLKKWYKDIRIESFSEGSVLVDYFIELNDVEERLDTMELKKIFHKSLHEAKPGSVVETVKEEPREEFDPDVMLGDQPDEERMKKSNEKMTKTIDKSAGKLEIGKFVMDPAYTEFIVLPKREEPTMIAPDEESFLPQWGIAVIVIAMASLLFVVIFGVTVLVNRQKSAKAKQPIPLSEDMLRELDKSHMGGFDDMHQMKERDLPYLPSGKRMSTAFIEHLAYPNAGDSWRSEWTPQMQKYMQHYTPDSGRGSQLYGTSGNAYGYSGSQIYGQTGGGGGSQIYGYTGEFPRSHHSRRRSEYDSNF